MASTVPHSVRVCVPDEQALPRLARALVAALPAGSFVALRGDLGAGKTTFVKAVAAVAGLDPADVVSPTYGLIHEHVGPRGRLVHADMYRLASPAELAETGWDDAVGRATWVFLEWPDRIGAALPAHRLDVTIEIDGPAARTFTLTGHGPDGEAVVDALAAARVG